MVESTATGHLPRIVSRLDQELGAQVPYPTVRDYVAARRPQIAAEAPSLATQVSPPVAIAGRTHFIRAFLRGYPGVQAGEETKLLRSRAGKAGSPPGRTGVHSHEPADGHKQTG